MPIGVDRPKIPLVPGAATESVQQVSWNGLLMLSDRSDAAYKRVLAELLGMRLGTTQVPRWADLLRELAGLGINGRRRVLVRAALDWSMRRQRFLNWWLRDIALGGSAIGVNFALPEMVDEMVGVERKLSEWRLLDEEVTP